MSGEASYLRAPACKDVNLATSDSELIAPGTTDRAIANKSFDDDMQSFSSKTEALFLRHFRRHGIAPTVLDEKSNLKIDEGWKPGADEWRRLSVSLILWECREHERLKGIIRSRRFRSNKKLVQAIEQAFPDDNETLPPLRHNAEKIVNRIKHDEFVARDQYMDDLIEQDEPATRDEGMNSLNGHDELATHEECVDSVNESNKLLGRARLTSEQLSEALHGHLMDLKRQGEIKGEIPSPRSLRVQYSNRKAEARLTKEQHRLLEGLHLLTNAERVAKKMSAETEGVFT